MRPLARPALAVMIVGAWLAEAPSARRRPATSLATQNPRIVPTARPIVGDLPASPTEHFLPSPPGIRVETWLPDLGAVWSLAFAPDGRLFLTEKPGRIRVVSREGRIDPAPWAAVSVVPAGGEGGLMGLALHPAFPREPLVYVMYTTARNGRVVNRVTRFREVDGRGTAEEPIVDDLPGALNHNGGRLAFGPDGMLYVSAGDAYHPMLAQDPAARAGAILRLTPDGRVPADNPWPGQAAWAIGLRNPNGLAFRPRDGALFAGDHGPTSEWFDPRIMDRDELNLVRKGDNHGWPLVVGAGRQTGLVDPLLSWIPSTPPGALLFYDAALLPDLRGDLLYSSLAGQALLRIRFQNRAVPDAVTSVERWFNTGPRGQATFGRLRALAVGPDGAIYVGTSNTDGRGAARAGDDRVLRISKGP